MSSNRAKIEALASQILLHKKLYYSGKAAIPDAAYDALEDELRSLDATHPVLDFVGYSLGKGAKKVAHEPPMLSLAKTYDVEDLNSFLAKHVCVQTDKFDGMALSIEFDSKGKLFRASTRGNGKLGEDVTEHVFHVADIPKSISLPQAQFYAAEVRGEVYFPISAFEKFKTQFDSYRNAVPGTFGRKEVELAAPVLHVLKFCAYDIIFKDAEQNAIPFSKTNEMLGLNSTSYFDRLKFLENHGFFTGVANGVAKKVDPQVEASADDLTALLSKKRDYQVDGLVFRVDDDKTWETLGITSHHPRGSLAFKQAGEVAVTRILDIEENVGRSGKITFRARLEPVNLSGAKITYATLHNAEFIESGNYAVGAKVKLTRSGEVIPSIVGLVEAAEKPYELPQQCPCGYLLTRQGPDLFCFEQRACVRKDQESLVHFVSVLDIMGISDKIILKLREAGLLQEPADLFKLTAEDFVEIEGFAKKSAENAVTAINERRKIPLATFLAALGLKRGGVVKCQEVARRFKTLAAVRNATAADLQTEKGWAEKSAEDFVQSLADKKQMVDNLLNYVEVQEDHSGKDIAAAGGHPLFGKVICITGALSQPREEYKKKLEAVGAKVTDSVSAKTQFLVCNEASGSKKYTQAQSLGIPVISEEKLASLLE